MKLEVGMKLYSNSLKDIVTIYSVVNGKAFARRKDLESDEFDLIFKEEVGEIGSNIRPVGYELIVFSPSYQVENDDIKNKFLHKELVEKCSKINIESLSPEQLIQILKITNYKEDIKFCDNPYDLYRDPDNSHYNEDIRGKDGVRA